MHLGSVWFLQMHDKSCVLSLWCDIYAISTIFEPLVVLWRVVICTPRMTLIHTCFLTASDTNTIVHIDKLSMTPPQQAETQILVSTLSTHVIVCLLTITQQSRSDTSADESILKTKKTTIAFSASQKVVLNKKRNKKGHFYKRGAE